MLDNCGPDDDSNGREDEDGIGDEVSPPCNFLFNPSVNLGAVGVKAIVTAGAMGCSVSIVEPRELTESGFLNFEKITRSERVHCLLLIDLFIFML